MRRAHFAPGNCRRSAAELALELRRNDPVATEAVDSLARLLDLLVSQRSDLRVALIGGRVLSTGVFEQSTGDDGVIHRGELVRTLDVRALYAQAETAIWAPRPGTPAAARESGGSTR